MKSVILLLLMGCAMEQKELVWEEDGHTYRPAPGKDGEPMHIGCDPTGKKNLRWCVREDGTWWMASFFGDEWWPVVPLIAGTLYGKGPK